MPQRAETSGATRSDRVHRRVTVPASGTALLLIDVINDLAFDGSATLVAQAEPMARRLAALKRRAGTAGVATIYINDNFGQWRSDFRKTVAHCTSLSSPGRRVSRRLRPTSHDYFVLKPKHSGFFDTTLDTLLQTLRIRRVILTGIAGNICVLFTATTRICATSRSSPPPIASSRIPRPRTITRCARFRPCSRETSPSHADWSFVAAGALPRDEILIVMPITAAFET